MQCSNKILFLLIFSLFVNLVTAQETVEQYIHFASASDELDQEAVTLLDELVELTLTATDFQFQLSGHTDPDGSYAYNERLSERRNQAVVNYLEQAGVNLTHIKFNAFGERKLLDREDSEIAKANNRRVEVQLTYNAVESVSEMLQDFAQKRKQYFSVNPSQANELKAKDGTIVRVPANAFIYEDGTPVLNSEVELVIEEAIRPSAMIFHQLNTSHGEEALTTGGMIRLSASVEGQPLGLHPEKQLKVYVPTKEANAEMRLYDGSRDSAGAMVWDELEAPVKVMPAAAVHATPVPFPEHLFTALDPVRIEMPEHPGKLADLPIPAIPPMPNPLIEPMPKPYKPGIPQRQIAQAPKGLFAKLRFDQEKEQAKLDQQYEKRKAKYEERMKAYENAMIAYGKNQAAYQKELAAIQAEHEVDKAVVIAERRKKLDAWLDRCLAYEAAHLLQQRIDNYKRDLSQESLHQKIYPDRAERFLPTFQFSISLRALDYFARGERMPPNEEPQYSKYLLAAEEATQRLAEEVKYDETWSQIKKDYLAYQRAKAEQLRDQNSNAVSGLQEKLDYYGYEVAAPNFSRWCNIDTPIPVGQSLLAFENTRFTEMFTFIPAQKRVSYFPLKKIKTAMFPAGQSINYLAFRYINNGIELAKGKVYPTKRQRIDLLFVKSSLAEVEQAILALDM